jgi:hypothetical protein
VTSNQIVYGRFYGVSRLSLTLRGW